MLLLVDLQVDSRIADNIPIMADSFPDLSLAVQRMADRGQSIWQQFASGAPLPGGKIVHARSGRYKRSIQVRRKGDFSSEIYSDLSYAKDIEQGTPARDLKRMLDTSMKVRMSKKGKRYLIIPFRHGAPSNTAGKDGKTSTGLTPMPDVVHDAWKGMNSSRIKSIGQRASGNGAFSLRTRNPYMVSKRNYQWGSRMTEDHLRELGIAGRQLKHMKGMVRMRNRTGEKGSSHSQYLTFRVMSEDSPGWLVKAREGAWPAKTTAEQIRPLAEKAFAGAMKEDIQRLL